MGSGSSGNRRSDETLFQVYTSITEYFQESLRNARILFPMQSGMPRYSLAISHATRVAVNRKYNLAQKLSQLNAVLYKAQPSTQDNRPQSFWAWPGLELIGAGGRAKKGLFYVVQSASAERLVLKGHGETLSLSADMAAKC